MEQISLPMRIALAATLVFGALWFVALRPKPATDSADAPLPATPAKTAKADTATGAKSHKSTSLLDRPDEARKAVDSANAATATREKAADAVGSDSTTKTSAPSAKPATPAKTETKAAAPKAAEHAATKAAATTDAPSTGAKAVVADIKAGKTVVLLFWAMNAGDDRAVKHAVDAANRHHGAVAVHTARMSTLPDYEAITKATPVTTSPTLFVIDKKAQAHVLTGLTTTREIDALVNAALNVK